MLQCVFILIHAKLPTRGVGMLGWIFTSRNLMNNWMHIVFPDRFRLWTRWFQINIARKGSTILTAVYPGQMACPIEPAIYLLAVLDNTEVGDCCNDNKGLNRLEQQHTSFSCWLQPEATFSKKNSPHWKAGKSNLSQLRADPLLIGWDQLSGKLLITDFSPHQCPHKDHWSTQHYNSFFFTRHPFNDEMKLVVLKKQLLSFLLLPCCLDIETRAGGKLWQ